MAKATTTQTKSGVMGFDSKPVLTPGSLHELVLKKLASSSLDEADAEALGIEGIMPDKVALSQLWWGKSYPAMKIPYPGMDFYRARCLLDPLPVLPADKKGKPQKFAKYTQLTGTAPHAYFPPTLDWAPILPDASKPLIMTEGELKAACAVKHGFPTIGLGGVSSFRSTKLNIDFLPELEAIEWKGRKVLICFDTEAKPNARIDEAKLTLATELRKRGAMPYQVVLPQLKAGQKTGLDDFLVARGREAFQALVDAAEEIQTWQSRYQTNALGTISNLANAMVALRYSPELQDAFGHDEMAWETVVMKPLPDEAPGALYPRPFADHDTTRVQEWLQRDADLAYIGYDTVFKAIQSRSRERSFDPAKDYFNALEWDGTPRVDTWLHVYMDAEDTPYTRGIGSMFLLALADRALHPGCKMDYVLVLFGKQGVKKSTASRIMAVNERWFTDQLPDIATKNKDLSENIVGKLVIEIPELRALRTSDTTVSKEFFSRTIEKYRPPYGRLTVERPRHGVFIGTTNKPEILQDITGNRRYWIVATSITGKHVDHELLKHDLDQLYAEAVARLRQGEKTFPDEAFEAEYIRPEQEEHTVMEPWCEAIRAKLEEFKPVNGWLTINKKKLALNAMNIALHCLFIEAKDLTAQKEERISNAMTQLGYTRARSGGIRRWTFSGEKTVEDGTVVPFTPPARRGRTKAAARG